jgi:hypothetical protein
LASETDMRREAEAERGSRPRLKTRRRLPIILLHAQKATPSRVLCLWRFAIERCSLRREWDGSRSGER